MSDLQLLFCVLMQKIGDAKLSIANSILQNNNKNRTKFSIKHDTMGRKQLKRIVKTSCTVRRFIYHSYTITLNAQN